MSDMWLAYKLRWRRRKYLTRAFRKRKEISPLVDRTGAIKPGGILCFSTVRNERNRLPFFLDHHRALGVDHFLVVENNSNDGTAEYLKKQDDVSVWSTDASYKAARFGVDWLAVLQLRFGAGHWCLTLDADEILAYPDFEKAPLPVLTKWLSANGAASMGALMLDMYPSGPLAEAHYRNGTPIWETLTHFDPYGYDWQLLPKFQVISIRGGPRRRMFFADAPQHAPHLHKIPLVFWRKPYAYVSSTHTALPRHLNTAFDQRRDLPTGVLLHSKFLPEVVSKSSEEKTRAEHFTHPNRYNTYYERIAASPKLWTPDSVAYEGSHQLESLGLMTRGKWRPE